ncbi:MAG: hypothetical protein KC978_13055, partial [Candidatus Omnitrophica bacterium]|nr:hypothetical protein [Candidatus Omnitrophota bacterium]
MIRPVIRSSLLSLILLSFPVLESVGEIPLKINHQGVVKVNGEPFSGTGEFRFALIDSESGDELWTNDGSSSASLGFPNLGVVIPVVSGLYSVNLGDASLTHMTAIPAEIFDGSNLLLRIWFSDQVNGVQRLFPDHVLSSAPYSFLSLRAMVAGQAEEATHATESDHADTAGDADTLDGYDSSDFLSQGPGNVDMLTGDFVVAVSESVQTGDVVSFVEGFSEIRSGYAPAGVGPIVWISIPDNSVQVELATLNENQFLVAYKDPVDGDFGKVLVATVAGDTISFGSPETFFPYAVRDVAIAKLSDTHLVVACRIGGDLRGIVRAGEMSESGIDFGRSVQLNVNPIGAIALTPISADRCIVAFPGIGTTTVATARVADVSGTSLSLGPEAFFHPEKIALVRLAALSTDRVLVAFQELLSGDGLAAIAEVVGNTLVFGPKTFYSQDPVFTVDCVPLGSNSFALAFAYGSAVRGDFRVIRVGHVVGDSIRYSEEFPYRTTATDYPIRIGALSPNAVALAEDYPSSLMGSWTVG